ncbi:hypothetical protein P7C71_g4720, partial [Lecanoromycetidae sp. Uapishka_2]
MSSESRLYTFSPETKEKLRKFRLGTSRAKDPQAVIYQVNKSNLEIAQTDDEVYSDMMLYAGAKELMKNTAEAGKIIELSDAEDLETIEEKLKGEQ